MKEYYYQGGYNLGIETRLEERFQHFAAVYAMNKEYGIRSASPALPEIYAL